MGTPAGSCHRGEMQGAWLAGTVYREFGCAAAPFPEELWGRKACGIVWCYTGPHDRAAEVLEPVKTFGSPLLAGSC